MAVVLNGVQIGVGNQDAGGDGLTEAQVISLINDQVPHGGHLPFKVIYMQGQTARIPSDPLNQTMPYDNSFITIGTSQVGALLLGWTGTDNEVKYGGDTAFSLNWTDLDDETDADWNAGSAPTNSAFGIDTDGDYAFEAHIFNSDENDPNLSLGLVHIQSGADDIMLWHRPGRASGLPGSGHNTIFDFNLSDVPVTAGDKFYWVIAGGESAVADHLCGGYMLIRQL